jgi:hypothetical protein
MDGHTYFGQCHQNSRASEQKAAEILNGQFTRLITDFGDRNGKFSLQCLDFEERRLGGWRKLNFLNACSQYSIECPVE